MAKDKRLFIGGLDKDSDYRVVQPNDYVDAINIRNVLSNSGNSAGAVENIKGNSLVTYTFPLSLITPKVIKTVFFGVEASSGTENFTLSIIKSGTTTSTTQAIDYTDAQPVAALLNSLVSNIDAQGVTITTVASDTEYVFGQLSIVYSANFDFSVTLTTSSGNIGGLTSTVTNFSSADVDYDVIGSYEDSENNSIYYFVLDKSKRNEDSIVEYNILENKTSMVYQDGRKDNPVLNFKRGNLITGITKVGDLLSWTDDNENPRMIDVEKAKQNEVNIANALSFTDNNFVTGSKVKFIGLPSTHNFQVGDLLYVVQDDGYQFEHYEGVCQVTATTSTTVTTNLEYQGNSAVSPGKIMYANPDNSYSPLVSFGTRVEKLMFLDYHKHQPTYAPTYEYSTNATLVGKNNLFGSLWEFKTRYRYKDGQYSAWSGISPLKTHVNYFSNTTISDLNTQDTFNQIDLSYLDSIDDIEKIEIAARKGNDAEFFLVETTKNSFHDYLRRKKINRTWYDVSYSDDGTPTLTTAIVSDKSKFYFVNDGLYPYIDKIEGDKLQDETPDKAKALTLIDGNRNSFGNYVVGKDNVDVDIEALPFYTPPPIVETLTKTPFGFNIYRGGSDGESGGFTSVFYQFDLITFNQEFDFSDDTKKTVHFNLKWDYKFEGNLTTSLYRSGHLNLTVEIPSYVNDYEQFLNYLAEQLTGLETGGNLTINQGSSYSNNAVNEDSSSPAFNGSGFAFDTNSQKVKAIVTDANKLRIRIRHGNNGFSVAADAFVYSSSGTEIGTNIKNITLTTQTNSHNAGFKSGAYHSLGVIYYDEKGKAGNVNTSSDGNFYVKFPTERTGENTNALGILNLDNEPYGAAGVFAKIHSNPPSWAHHWQWVYSGNNTVDEFIQFGIEDVKFNTSQTADTNIYLSLNSFEGQNYSYKALKNPLIDYDYVEGDRIRFIGRYTNPADSTTFVHFTKYYDFKITGSYIFVGEDEDPINATGKWISIEDSGESGFTDDDSTSLTNLQVEIYRPKKEAVDPSLLVYKEIGDKYEVLNPGQPTAAHSDEAFGYNQIFGYTLIPEGDIYFKPRNFRIKESTSNVVSATVEDYYLNDFYNTNHYNQGRHRLIDNDAGERRYESSITYSQPYFSNSKSNGLSNFNPYNVPFKDYNEGYGSIQALKTREDGIIMFQENKVSKILVSRNIIQSPDGAGIVTASTEVLSPAAEYAGDFGISKNPESLVQHGYVFYFCDVKRGAVLRLSREGISKISDNNMRSFFRDKGNDYTNINEIGTTENSDNYRLKAGYDPEYDEYVVTFPSISNEAGNFNAVVGDWNSISGNWGAQTSSNTLDAQTVAFSELLKKWTTFYSYIPSYYAKVNRQFFSFKDGDLYKHNNNSSRCNFYGSGTFASIDAVFNGEINAIKIYKSLSLERDNSFYSPSIKTELITSGVSIAGELFSEKEGIRSASIPFGGPVGGGTSVAGLGTCSYTDSTDTLSNSSGEFLSLGVFSGMKVYKYHSTTPVLIGTINDISSNTSMTITQDGGYSGNLTDEFFYVDLKSISGSAEGERIRGQYAIVKLAVPTGSQAQESQLFSASVEVESSELSNQ